MQRRFNTLDVFTEKKLAGNPLAVVHDCDGLDTAAMQAIAREFNLAETVFVFPPGDPVNSAKIRIFTPARELPFAGHPTVGAAVLIATLRAPEMMKGSGIVVALEEEIGLVRVEVRQGKDKLGNTRAARGLFTLPRNPERKATPRDSGLLAAALGLDKKDIGFGSFKPADFSAGVLFTMVPIRTLEALGKAKAQLGVAFDLAFAGPDPTAAYLYTPDGDNRWRTRMFAPSMGIAEDPATGAAAAAFAATLMAFQNLGDGEHQHIITQGVEMGRSSEIVLTLEVRNGTLDSASIGGAAIILSEGILDI
jgi:trans-2,3-dihydro-3-hydroxyanthranilate isomerase